MFLARAVVLLTGSFSEGKENLKRTITTHGGQVENTLSRKVTHVVRGEGASKTKLQEAEELNISIVDEEVILSSIKEGKILVPWFTNQSTKTSTNESIFKLFQDTPEKNSLEGSEDGSSNEKEQVENEEVNQMSQQLEKLTHEEVLEESTPSTTFSSKQEVSPSKEEPILSPLSKVMHAKELVVEARKLESEGKIEAALALYRKASEMVSYNEKLRKKVERLAEIIELQSKQAESFQCNVPVEEEPAEIPIVPPQKEVMKEKQKKSSKKRATTTRTPAKNLTVFDFTDTPPSQEPKKERKRTGSLSGTTFFIYGTFSLPRRTIETLITMEGGSISKMLSSQVTHFLFDGNVNTTSFEKAKQMQIHIVDEYFLDMLNEEH